MELRGLDKFWKYKAWIIAPIAMFIYGATILNGTIVNFSYVKRFVEAQNPATIKVELVVTNKTEISDLFKLRTEAIKSKNCEASAAFEAKYFYANKEAQEDWLNECQKNIDKVLAYDFMIYKWDKVDEENYAEVLTFEIVDERNNGSVEKVFYERRFYLGKQLESPYPGKWMIQDTTKNKFKKEIRKFE